MSTGNGTEQAIGENPHHRDDAQNRDGEARLRRPRIIDVFAKRQECCITAGVTRVSIITYSPFHSAPAVLYGVRRVGHSRVSVETGPLPERPESCIGDGTTFDFVLQQLGVALLQHRCHNH